MREHLAALRLPPEREIELVSVVNGVLLNPLSFPQPDQLITLHLRAAQVSALAFSFPASDQKGKCRKGK